MPSTRIYEVRNTEGDFSRLVEAASASQAVRHVTKAQYKVSVPSAMEVAKAMAGGAKVETAGEA